MSAKTPPIAAARRVPEGRIPEHRPGEVPERILPGQMKYCPDHVARYRFASQWAPGSRVLDICCGTGYGSVMLGAAGAEAVLGVDICVEAIEVAKERWHPPSVRFAVGDAQQFEPGERFDVAVCFEGLEHVQDGDRLVKNAAAALVPNGILIISTPHASAQPGGHSGNPFHLKEYYLDEFTGLIDRHFSHSRLYYQRRNDPLDAPWTLVRMLKGFIPANLRRRRAKSRSNQASIPGPTGDEWLAYDTVDRWYPRPWSYLGCPGMEPDFQPTVLMAVCQGPRPG